MKLTTEKINELLGVDESFHASYKLIEILSSPSERELLFTNFLKEEQDLSFDWFTEYFQAEHSDRKGKKQDFTPDGIIRCQWSSWGNSFQCRHLCRNWRFNN
ncbi:hypothetical protein EfsSVR2281_11720 [Enterococcus faecalis]|nr:hypothetical protein EfsSVR2281_11720 [Enterococcus faecalis]